jgi:hypothetical protein
MDENYRERLKIPVERLGEINAVLLDPETRGQGFPAGGGKIRHAGEINQKAISARQLSKLMKRVEEAKPEYLKDLAWLQEHATRRFHQHC